MLLCDSSERHCRNDPSSPHSKEAARRKARSECSNSYAQAWRVNPTLKKTLRWIDTPPFKLHAHIARHDKRMG
jgi:hypothetical protein